MEFQKDQDGSLECLYPVDDVPLTIVGSMSVVDPSSVGSTSVIGSSSDVDINGLLNNSIPSDTGLPVALDIVRNSVCNSEQILDELICQ